MNRQKRQAALVAELELLAAEEEFVAKKLAGTLTNEDRLALRELRASYRLNHRAAVKDGATVGTIERSL